MKSGRAQPPVKQPEIIALTSPATAGWGRHISQSDYEKLMKGCTPRDENGGWLISTDATTERGDMVIHICKSKTLQEQFSLHITKNGSTDNETDYYATIANISWAEREDGEILSERDARAAAINMCNDILGCKISNPAALYSALGPGMALRLLNILPDSADSLIRCQLFQCHLEQWSSRYATVSYCWGDPNCLTAILINGHPVNVPASSAAALRRIRHVQETATVWIDAICIDQDNEEERSRQVPFMQHIYSNGRENFICLWEEDSRAALRSLRDIQQNITKEFWSVWEAKQHVSKNMLKTPIDAPALRRLLSHSWFWRAWTFQECLLSSRNICLCGGRSISLDVVTSAAVFLYEHWLFMDAKDRLPGFHEALGSVASLFEASITVRRAQLISNNHQALEGDRNAIAKHLKTAVPYQSFMYYLQATSHRISYFPLDKIYGILALGPGLHVHPDYSKTPAEVCMEIANRTAHKEQSIDFLRGVEYYRQSDHHRIVDGHELPSWVPDWTRTLGRENQLKPFAPLFRACGHTSYEPLVSHLEARRLIVSGFVFDSAARFESLDSSIRFLGDTLDRVLCHATEECKQSNMPIAEWEMAMAHLLCGGRDYSKGRTDSGVRSKLLKLRAVVDSLQSRLVDLWGANPVPDAEGGLAVGDVPDAEDTREARSYWETLQIMWIKRKFFTTSEGRLGLGPELMEPGDSLVILYGLKWPAVLRKTETSWLFVGLAYIHGVMDGEAVTEHRRHKPVPPDEEFALV